MFFRLITYNLSFRKCRPMMSGTKKRLKERGKFWRSFLTSQLSLTLCFFLPSLRPTLLKRFKRNRYALNAYKYIKIFIDIFLILKLSFHANCFNAWDEWPKKWKNVVHFEWSFPPRSRQPGQRGFSRILSQQQRKILWGMYKLPSALHLNLGRR